MRNGSPVSSDVPGDPLADPGLQHLHRRARRDEVAAEGDRPQVVPVTDEDAAVVVIDQEPELLGDRGADLRDVVEPAQLRRHSVEQLQVGDRADLGAPVDVLLGGAFDGPVLEDDDLRPGRVVFAVIIATSAQATSSRGFAACSGPEAIPIERLTEPTGPNVTRAICSCTRSARR